MISLSQTRQPMYVQHNIQARSRNHCCREKAVIVTYLCLCACTRAWVGACVCVCKGVGVCLRVCSFTYPACNANSLCCLQPRWLHQIFRRYLINGTIIAKTLLNMKCVIFIFFTTSIWKVSQSKRKSAICCHKCENWIFLDRFSKRT